jgi:hypothetical protein
METRTDHDQIAAPALSEPPLAAHAAPPLADLSAGALSEQPPPLRAEAHIPPPEPHPFHAAAEPEDERRSIAATAVGLWSTARQRLHDLAAPMLRRRAEMPEAISVAPAPARGNRFAMLAGTVALAGGIGAAAGAAGFAGATKLFVPAPAPVAAPAHVATRAHRGTDDTKALKDAMTQMRGSIRALTDNVNSLRANVEASAKAGNAATAKLNEQVGKLHEQLAKVNETADLAERARQAKQAAVTPQHMPTTLQRAAAALERTPPASGSAVPPAAAPEVTGSIPTPAPRPDASSPARPNGVEGWTLRRVYDGVALVEGRYGAFEVEPGDTIRGLGRVQDIRRQDGHWVVVTSRGLILPH